MFGTMSWIVYTHIKIGTITAANLSANYALLTGAVVSLGWSILMCVTFSFIWPDKEPFQWERLTKVSRHTYVAEELMNQGSKGTSFQAHQSCFDEPTIQLHW